MGELSPDDWDRLNAALDDELAAAERAALDLDLRQRPELAGAYRSLLLGERAARALYGPGVEAQGGPVESSPRRFIRANPGLLAAAAAVLIAFIGLYAAGWFAGPRGGYPGQPLVMQPGPLYRTLRADFRPVVVCDTPAKFAHYTRRELGVELHADFDTGVTFLGWMKPADGLGRDPWGEARILLARDPGGRERVVAIGRELGPLVEAPVDDGVRVFMSAFGGLTALEIVGDEGPGDAAWGAQSGPSILPLISIGPAR